MTTLRFHSLSVRRFTRTLTNYIFSESLIIEDYKNVFRQGKKTTVSKIETKFLKSTSFTKSVPLQSRMIWRERRTSCQISHLCLKNRVSEFSYLAWFIFCTQLNFEVRRNTSSLSFTAHNFWIKAKNKIRWHGFGVKLCGNTVAKFELKWLKTRWTRT